MKTELKLTASSVVLVLALAIAGCGEEKKQEEQAADTPATGEQTAARPRRPRPTRWRR